MDDLLGRRASPSSAQQLEHWLARDLARQSPAHVRSRLRELADAQGTATAAWASGIAVGAVLVIAGVAVTALGAGLAPLLALAALGAGLMALGTLGCRRVRSRLPPTARTLRTRGPGSARGGVGLVVALALLLGAMLGYGASISEARGGAPVAVFVVAYLLIVLLLVACILVPAAIMGRSRETFRRRAQRDPRLRALLEDDLRTWRDPVGTARYGPL